eukprot:TRINITY_DN5925_c0_g1_i1.p1 TRINITY_DN5925_c0_g1~~TRINITY_DN5925_c0_g1_i1.p1  ORF type:complete len:325 (+),score=74.68 TRINITY_DN5925_c0_g1_i1:75-1049(+)
MRPILLKGHTGPITSVKFNREGDLLFSCARKDTKCTVWFSDNGERLGTYNGHKGAVWDCDVNYSSTRLLTASADTTAKLWDMKTGKELYSFAHEAGVRSVGFAQGDHMLLTVQDNQYSKTPTIFVYNVTDDIKEQSDEPIRSLQPSGSGKICTALWGALNQTILSASDDGIVRLWDTEKGAEIASAKDHKEKINSMQFSKDHTMIITASSDKTARVYDARRLELLKTFKSDRPLNSAAISPLKPHVICGGGQEASDVTTTATSVGRFETSFYNLIFEDFIGSVKGHFGPINTLAFSPDGKSFASGSEDGYVRLQHFDNEYLNSA